MTITKNAKEKKRETMFEATPCDVIAMGLLGALIFYAVKDIIKKSKVDGPFDWSKIFNKSEGKKT